ncbi:MAG: hypothetical protein H0V18_06300 [Pyrinomonadaceae bacterium]|jgi:hypothetical protein|nr:hypothetical protein [Pyrinomonadaceae bacterium]
MKGVLRLVERIGPADANVLITGENTGKEVMATSKVGEQTLTCHVPTLTRLLPRCEGQQLRLEVFATTHAPRCHQ